MGRLRIRLWLELAALGCSFVAIPAANAQTPDATPVITNPADLHFLDVNAAFHPVNDTWRAQAPMPTARAGMAVAIAKASEATGAKIYAIGGREAPDCSTLQTVQAYDPVMDKWTTGLAEPPAKRWRAAGGTLGNIIYLVGGESREGEPEACGPVVAIVEAYNAKAGVLGTWLTKMPMNTARSQVSLAADEASNKLYAIGGSNGSQGVPPFVALPTVERYDPLTDEWTSLADMKRARALPSVGVIGGKIYAVGGQDANHVAINTVEDYDIATGMWTLHRSDASLMPHPRLNPGAAVLDGKIYVVGGEKQDFSGPISTVDVYDPSTDSWTVETPMPSVRRLLGAAVVKNVLYAVGGEAPTATVGQQMIFQITATNNPTFYDALPSPPPGLSVNHELGIISGVPTVHNDNGFPVTLTARNASGTGMKDVSFFIAAAPSPTPGLISIISSTCATGRAGRPFTFQVLTENASSAAQLTASGFPYKEGVGPELSIDPVTGLISGTVTLPDRSPPKSFGVALALTDGTTTAHSFLQLTFISDPNFPILTSSSAATLVPGQFFSYTITADAPATFGLFDITPLPPGLSFQPPATISGTYMPGGSRASRTSEIQSAPDTITKRPPLIAIVQDTATNSTGTGTSTNSNGIGTGTGPLNFFEPSAVSRKIHGTAGPFDINLPLAGDAGTPGIECRDGGANKDYQVVFTFPTALVTLSGATVTPGAGGSGRLAGPPIISSDRTQVTVNLTNVSDVQTITIRLLDVNDGINTNLYKVTVQMGVLIGDTIPDGSGSVDSADVSLTRQEVGQTADASNFREDVNVNGSITSSDVSLVRSNLGHILPPP